MQPEAKTTTRGSLAVSAGAFEIANVIQGALEVFWFTFTFYLYGLQADNIQLSMLEHQIQKWHIARKDWITFTFYI